MGYGWVWTTRESEEDGGRSGESKRTGGVKSGEDRETSPVFQRQIDFRYRTQVVDTSGVENIGLEGWGTDTVTQVEWDSFHILRVV